MDFIKTGGMNMGKTSFKNHFNHYVGRLSIDDIAELNRKLNRLELLVSSGDWYGCVLNCNQISSIDNVLSYYTHFSHIFRMMAFRDNFLGKGLSKRRVRRMLHREFGYSEIPELVKDGRLNHEYMSKVVILKGRGRC